MSFSFPAPPKALGKWYGDQNFYSERSLQIFTERNHKTTRRRCQVLQNTNSCRKSLRKWFDFSRFFITFGFGYQGFYQHAEEDDPQRIEAIISRAVEDADWIVKKVITKEISLYKFQ